MLLMDGKPQTPKPSRDCGCRVREFRGVGWITIQSLGLIGFLRVWRGFGVMRHTSSGVA